ncbi:hypothetical protein AC579_4312 [Pseudocercospora musae]|uniref:SCP2 domain-containing protein n=1 Tax=Pseudocercospora musae TaxID=113226 RepID=A0A139IR97_9PEZI|nr:hypothetical protein AC579_4312 [Pseudocercospora musae]
MAPAILASPENGIANVINGASAPAYKRRAEVDEPQRALKLIKEHLSKMSPLKAILKLDIGLESGPLYLDARSEPVLIPSQDTEPACSVKIKPEYIKQFVDGKLEPRYGLFKDGFFDETTLPKGDIKVAVKFADYLCPVDRISLPPTPEPEKLPKPTQDIEQVLADVKKFGYGLVSNALSPTEISTLRSAIQQQAAGEIAAGVSKHDGGPDSVNQRIWTLINKGPEFHSLLEHPLIDDIVPEMLGEYFLIHSYSANIARPGNVPMMVHTDQVGIQPPVRDMYYGLNIMWFLEDVTEQNGGTRVWPGSHLGNCAPDDPFSIEGSIAAEGKAGTALVFESRLWHATGPNRLSEGERPVILMFFMRSFVRQQENNFLSIRPEVEASMSDKVRKMLGFVTNGAFGGVEGEVREGTFVKRLENPVGMFRATHSHTPFREEVREGR